MPSTLSKQLLIRISCYILPIVIIFTVWLPLIAQYHTRDIIIQDELIDTSRRFPTDLIFDELTKFNLTLQLRPLRDKQCVSLAEKILLGKVELPGGPPVPIGLPFDDYDLDKKVSGRPGWRFFFATFSIPDILLRAYELTGRDEFLVTARDIILSWGAYERSAWLPKGLLWNDHAISARILVLAKFWKLYRGHKEYKPDAAKAVFQLVARYAQLLSKPSHFTFSTNHGIIQNLSLWHICVAFPNLPSIEVYKKLVFERMSDQMAFYINDEGIVLEHSAEYQRVALEFIGMAFRYLTLMNLTIPDEWRVKYKKAKDFYAELRRPNGSLPMFGDTNMIRDQLGPPVTDIDTGGRSDILEYKKDWIPKRSRSLYPVAGYSVWWDGLDKWLNENELKQTVVAWSHFPGHAHKHADEMSVLLWAGGENWWTNVGYWPYGTKGRGKAVSWAGSNAPHLAHESTHSERNTKLLSYGSSDYLNVIDLQRRGPNEYGARRQVIYLKPNLWVVIDYTEGSEDSLTTTTWTTSPGIRIRQGNFKGSYILESEKDSANLAKFVLTSEDVNIELFRGSFEPFAGWVQGNPATSIVIKQSAKDSWSAAVWSIQDDTSPTLQFTGPPSMASWEGSENWKIVLPLASGRINIWRQDNRVFVSKDKKEASSYEEITLSEAPEIKDELSAIHQGFENAKRKYPRKNFSMHRHKKATYFVLLLFFLQEVFFLLVGRFRRKYCTTLRLLNSVGWMTVGIWIVIIYLERST